MVAGGDHVGQPGGEGLDGGHEVVPHRGVAVGVGDVAHVQREVQPRAPLREARQRAGRARRLGRGRARRAEVAERGEGEARGRARERRRLEGQR
jgi:hypothetical protein